MYPLEQDPVVLTPRVFPADKRPNDAVYKREIRSRMFGITRCAAHCLIQHVTGATHTRGHTLDVLITRDISCIIHGMPSIVNPCLYDIKGNRSGDPLGILWYWIILSRSTRKRRSLSGDTVLCFCQNSWSTSKHRPLSNVQVVLQMTWWKHTILASRF